MTDPRPQNTTAPDDANMRAIFTEACQMFRQMVMMRYYALAAFALGNTALIALFFNYRPLNVIQQWAVRILAAVVSFLCIGFEVRITQPIAHFQSQINLRARHW